MSPLPTEAPKDPERPEKEEEQIPQLPLDFWRSLVDRPGCQTPGVCNECGRCEH